MTARSGAGMKSNALVIIYAILQIRRRPLLYFGPKTLPGLRKVGANFFVTVCSGSQTVATFKENLVIQHTSSCASEPYRSRVSRREESKEAVLKSPNGLDATFYYVCFARFCNTSSVLYP